MSKRRPATRDQPSTVDQALARAIHALQTAQPAEAERLAAAVFRSNRGNVLAAQVLGEALLLQKRPGEAVDPLQRAARRSQDPATETLLAMALADSGRGEEALDELRRATGRRPAFPLAFLELGDRLGDLGRFDEAIDVFERGLALSPDAIVLRVGLGHLHLKRNDRVMARNLFSQVRAAAPERQDALVALARVLSLDGEYPAAADLYRRALALRPDDAVTRINLGRCLLEMGARGAGEASLREAARAAPHLTGLAAIALAATPHGRFFLRPSAVAGFLRVDQD